ncbi:MAG: tetratricopeptide repeat protein [Spirochaetaceae bacterium]|jgi:Flp pilus assembly protein TadD|nr:tetratricopeptide repeat protein [Spirochaetaceae bacterium]
MQSDNPIIFLEVPESLRGQELSGHEHEHEDEHHHEHFHIDPDKKLPVEIDMEGFADIDAARQHTVENLTWEAVLAGMLRVLENPKKYEADKNSIDYYRDFVLSIRPKLPQEWTSAAIFKAKDGNFIDALDILTILQGLTPDSPSVLYNKALILEALEDEAERKGQKPSHGSAEVAYIDLLSLTPPFPDGFFNAAFYFIKQNQYAKAAEYLARYIEFEDIPPEKAEKAAAMLAEIDKNSLDDEIFANAYSLIKEDREDEALDEIRDFIERKPGVWNAWFLLGWALRKLERWEDAAAAFSQAISLFGESIDEKAEAELLNEAAICKIETGNTADAKELLLKALQIDADNTKIISNLGVLALKEGKKDEAEGYFRTVLEIDPEDPLAKKMLET